MKEKIGKQINEFLSLDCYLKLVGLSSLLVGLGLFVYCTLTVEHQYMIPTIIAQLHMTSNPLFYLIFGFLLLCFRYFMKITDKEMEV